MRDVSVPCPHCAETLEVTRCDKCKSPVIRNDDEEKCSDCEGDFCADHVTDHDCTGEPDESEISEDDEDEG